MNTETTTRTWFTISEISSTHNISRHKIIYWLKRLQLLGQARKTGNSRRDPWLVHEDAIEFLKEHHKAGRKSIVINDKECQRWTEKWLELRSVQAVANHFGVVWQTAARKLDKCGVRPYNTVDRLTHGHGRDLERCM